MELPKPTVLQSIQQSTILHTRPSQKKTIKYIIYVFLDFATGVFDKPRVFRPQALPTLCCKNMEYSRPPLNQLSLLVPSKKPEKSGFFRTQRSEKTAYICTHSGFWQHFDNKLTTRPLSVPISFLQNSHKKSSRRKAFQLLKNAIEMIYSASGIVSAKCCCKARIAFSFFCEERWV